jgi:hypothetical protein
MRLLTIFSALCATALATSSDLIDSTTVSIQAISASSNGAVTPLAEIKYNPSTLSAEIVSFSLPELEPSSKLLRVGIYDAATSTWKSSTSTASVENFAKGYRPTIVLNLDSTGGVLGVSLKASIIDAGQTRDFGPKVLVKGMGKTKSPDLNRPIVLNPEGKVDAPEPEKTMLQK